MRARLAFACLGSCLLAALAIGTGALGWAGLWASPDQRGRLDFQRGRYAAAADAFRDPMWRGVAQMRAGDFKAAEQTFAAIDTAPGAYDHGNALVMLGKYPQAVIAYDRALALRPGWPDAQANRRIAQIRAARTNATGADNGEQREGVDQIVYDKDAKRPGGQDTQTSGRAMNNEAVRALWLKRIQTKPADFLRARFGYQLQAQQGAKPP